MDRDETSVLFVCHANLCRSPMAERLAELAVARRLGAPIEPTGTPHTGTPHTGALRFASAGTHAAAGDPMHRHSVRTLFEYGASRRPFHTRRVCEALLTGADLVLTANREQRAHCVRLAPATLRRTFTLREFGRLCGATGPGSVPDGPPAERMRHLVRAAATARADFQPDAAQDDDLPDPVGQPLESFLSCAGTIWAAVAVMADRLIPAAPGTGPAPAPVGGATTG
jgi:protein-tyrosine phosphatase